MNKDDLINNLVPPLDKILLELLIDEFNNLENRFIICDWEPFTLDGGQFVEIYSRLIYHIDSGQISRRKDCSKCLLYIEDVDNKNKHFSPNIKAFHLICKVLQTIYKFRSQRGSIHIDPDYTANEIDSYYLVSAVRWLFSELLRLFWQGSPIQISKIIQEIVNFKFPIVFKGGLTPLVLQRNLTTEEEILILINSNGNIGLTKEQLFDFIPKSRSSISKALISLSPQNKREITISVDGKYINTPIGNRRILTYFSIN